MLQSQHIGEKLQLNTPDVFNKDNRDFAFFDVQVHTYTNECADK